VRAARRNGKKGAERTIALHGYKSLFEGCRRSRLANPSPNELVMMGLLKQLRLECEREYVLGETLYTLDFYLAKYWLGIEVDGSIHDAGKPGERRGSSIAQRKAALCREDANQLDPHPPQRAGRRRPEGVINKIQQITGLGEPVFGSRTDRHYG